MEWNGLDYWGMSLTLTLINGCMKNGVVLILGPHVCEKGEVILLE